eukprot:CAMPEP_0194780974 /NCGR_PEP_ID=MMETSP0323_2-20130528/74986_1 /TAXON_ID=2866 ORGANISM="Crypthecodinium cohnii, Strain Seligo" /NCGR_SAMPLE_ID=MMETSP0323_2 /ASSEMBLY_ACC=CAM_ASM_000346 /LENGTH=59 /DNA_ID=CAMNT_0039719163 /DNA_START=437 /DNA_END=612 /DNA_ORIENTATION=+
MSPAGLDDGRAEAWFWRGTVEVPPLRGRRSFDMKAAVATGFGVDGRKFDGGVQAVGCSP